MCGFCGIVYDNRNREVNPELLERMVDTMDYRGPDVQNVHIDKNVGMAHSRLKVIDLSETANQPMFNEDKSLTLVYNGEIYNFRELRKKLRGKGHCFKSFSDTEVLLHLYEEEGKNLVKTIRGMFAFAIWDSSNQELFLTRDRVGQKPLVYFRFNGGIAFASELKAFLHMPEFKKSINKEAIHHYLTYQYVPNPLTIFEEIKKLPPAHTLVYRNKNVYKSQYWQLSYTPKSKQRDIQSYEEEFTEIFDKAVKERLVSDVPLGAFLSGGLDSSAVVATMSKFSSDPVKTFSIGYDESDFDESSYASLVADKFSTDHHSFTMKPDVIDILPRLVWFYNEPFADPSAIPTYYVSKYAREYVTVALNGDGGDESFAGYQRYKADKLCHLGRFIPDFLKNSVKGLVGLLPHQTRQTSLVNKIKRLVQSATENPVERYISWIEYFNTETKSDLYTNKMKDELEQVDSASRIQTFFSEADGDNLIDRLLFTDVNSYLPDDLLVKMDIASMANSLEARSPFLDHRLMEFAASLPAKMKLNGFQSKYLLKKTFEGVLPDQIIHREKMGFGVPLNHWFRGKLKNFLREILLSTEHLERGYFRKDYIKKLIEEHQEGTADHSYRLWALLVLEIWHREFI